MNGLLDTHTFLWAAMYPEKLSRQARQGITPEELPNAATQMGFTLLALAPQDAATFYQLPRFQHKDLFDRMLVWQSICQHLTLLSKDPDLRQYEAHGLRVLW